MEMIELYLLTLVYLHFYLASHARNEELQEKLWTYSENLVKEKIGA
jgi:hypothetical protein